MVDYSKEASPGEVERSVDPSSLIQAAEDVTAESVGSLPLQKRGSIRRIIGRRGLPLVLATTSFLAAMGCGNVSKVEVVSPRVVAVRTPTPVIPIQTPIPIPRTESRPVLEEKRIVELPGDTLKEQELRDLGITITNISNFDFYLRKGILDIPLLKHLKETRLKGAQSINVGGRQVTLEQPTFDIIILGSRGIPKDELEKIPDLDLKRYLKDKKYSHVEAAGNYFDDDIVLKDTDKELRVRTRHFLIVALDTRGKVLTENDNLPLPPKVLSLERKYPNRKTREYVPMQFTSHGQWLATTFRHEVSHFLQGDEWETDLAALRLLEDASKKLREKNDDSGYYFVLRDRGNNIVIKL